MKSALTLITTVIPNHFNFGGISKVRVVLENSKRTEIIESKKPVFNLKTKPKSQTKQQ